MRSGGYGIGSMTRYVGRFNPVGNSMYAGMSSVFGGATGAVYRMTQRVARQEAQYGYSRYGHNDATKYNRAFERCIRFMPRWAPEANNNSSSSAAPQQAQQAQRAGGANKANASGGAKDLAAEKAKAKQEQHDNIVSTYKEYRKIKDKDGAKDDGGAVGVLKGKGYTPDEARTIVAMLNKTMPVDFGGDPIKAKAAFEKYQKDLALVPARKNGKGEKLPHAEWAAKYAEWLGGMKGVKPSNAAQIPISDVMGVTGKKKKKVSKKIAKHALLVSIGLKTTKGGKVYDAYRVDKSTDDSIVPNNATVVRDGDKWFVLEKDVLTRIKRGKGNPIFDERGILIVDPRFKEIQLVPNKKKFPDAGDINAEVEAWIAKNPEVKTKRNSADKRAEHVKKELEKKLHGHFGSNVVSVSAEGKNVMIRILGDDAQRGGRAKAVAAYMEKHETHFDSVLGDLGDGAVIQVQKEATRVSAGQNETLSNVVAEIKKLSKTTAIQIDMFANSKPTADDMMKAVGDELSKTVVVKGTVVTLKFVKGEEPTKYEWEAFEKRIKDKHGDKVTVRKLVIDVKAEKAKYTAKEVTELKKQLVAAHWDGKASTKAKAETEADDMIARARDGQRRVRGKPVVDRTPIPLETFKKSIAKKRREHVDDMRKSIVAAKGTAQHAQLVKEYTDWWKIAGKSFSGARAEYYKPETVEKASPRTPAVHKSKRGKGGKGERKPIKPKKGGRKDPRTKKADATPVRPTGIPRGAIWDAVGGVWSDGTGRYWDRNGGLVISGGQPA